MQGGVAKHLFAKSGGTFEKTQEKTRSMHERVPFLTATDP